MKYPKEQQAKEHKSHKKSHHKEDHREMGLKAKIGHDGGAKKHHKAH